MICRISFSRFDNCFINIKKIEEKEITKDLWDTLYTLSEHSKIKIEMDVSESEKTLFQRIRDKKRALKLFSS